MLAEAGEIVALLPPQTAGNCVLGEDGELLSVPPSALLSLLERGAVRFHPGRLRGAFPQPITRP